MDNLVVSSQVRNIDGQSLAVSYNSHAEYFFGSNNISTSVSKDIRHIKTDFYQFYQNNKQELQDLNERFRLFLSSVRGLELENSQFALEIETFRKDFFGLLHMDEQWNENYKNSQYGLRAIAKERFEHESEVELSQLQVQMYEQLYNFQHRLNAERRAKLEQDLKQSSGTLNMLRTSYQSLEQEVKVLHVTHEDTVKQYFVVTREYCGVKKQQKQLSFDVQTLKSQLVCYKSLNAHAYQTAQAFVASSVNSAQFWSVEFEKCVQKIRHDFELLYASIYRHMVGYYEEKNAEMHAEVEHSAKYRASESELFAVSQQSLQVEYEEVQTYLARERERQVQYEAEIVKLEAEYQALQVQYEERFGGQAQLLANGQQEIVAMAFDIGEIRRSAVALESEIIVYRHLLDSYQIRQVAPVSTEIAEKVVVVNESKRKGPVGIKECAASGKYIVLVNHSSSQDVDISKWVLKRRLDSASDVLYTIPSGTELQHNQELTVYSKIGAEAVDTALNHRAGAAANREIVGQEISSWGMGTVVETFLIDQSGEEKASHVQSLGFGGTNVRSE